MSSSAPPDGLSSTGVRTPHDEGAAEPGWAPLEAACERVLERWTEYTASWIASREQAAEALEHLVAQVEPPPTGEASATPCPRDAGKALLQHRLVEALRTELLRSWSEDSAGKAGRASETLSSLVALERYQAALRGANEEDLTSRLSEPDAFELIVELIHDLRSPLNSILFLSEALRSGRSGPLTEQQRSQLGLIYSATFGVISVVNDVMDTASENPGTGSEEPTVFSMVGMLGSVEEIVRPMAEEKGLSLAFDALECDRCIGLPKPLTRALLNLTTNAIKFTERGEVTVTASRMEGDRVQFSVTDTGRGIPPDKLETLYHPFHKSSYRSGHFFSGSGLGLSIARRLVVSMGGDLQVETAPNAGTRFHFEVKLPEAGGG